MDLVRKAYIPSVSTAWQWCAVIEVYKALNGLSRKYMQWYVHTKTTTIYVLINKILFTKCHTINFGLKSFAYQPGSLWNKLSNSFRTCESLKDFTTKIFTWSNDMWYTFNLTNFGGQITHKLSQVWPYNTSSHPVALDSCLVQNRL